MPGNDLHLSVCVSHPNHGNYFSAVLTGHVSTQPWLRNEEAGLLTLVKYVNRRHCHHALLLHQRQHTSTVWQAYQSCNHTTALLA